jgi:hypothetical protein
MKIKKKSLLLIAFFVFLGYFYAPKSILAYNEYQKCDKNTSCIVGEFLYDDSYVPIATAECRFTSRYPNGDLFINGELTNSTSDGWYSYIVEATGSAGLYRSQLCCQAGTDYLCLDKSYKIEATTSALTKTDVANAVWDEPRANHTQSGSFGAALQNIVPSASDIALAVWGYSGRTLDNFGTLPSDVWNYTSRTLSSFGSLIANIWGHSDRTLTSGGSGSTTNNYYTTNNNSNNTTNNANSIDTSSLAKKSDLDNLKKEVMYNQSLLEKLANKPIITNFLEEEKDVNLDAKLNQSQLYLTKLFTDSYSLDSKVGMVDVKWKEFDEKKLQLVLKDINKLNTSITESAKKLKGLWNLALADNLAAQTETLRNRTAIIESDIKVEGRSRTVLEDFKSLSFSLDSFINTLGSSSDKAGKETLYSKVNEIKTLADTFDLYSSDVDKLLADWKKVQIADTQKKTDLIADKLAKINKLPRTITVVSSQPDDNLNKKLKNRLLSIKATIFANKTLLAKSTEKPFSSSWLEEGSVIFKTMLTNPSSRISQEVPLKYYLPSEVKKEDVMNVDDGLKIKYDVDKKQLYVEGTFNLGPNESRVVSVRVEDIWNVNENTIESLRRQATDLLKPLEKTSYFGQGVTIKSSIDVILDKILANLKSAVTPENKIKNYYEAQIELKGVEEQIKKLQDLVTQAGSFGSMAGFIGGAQAIAVWGLIIIMVAGFVFLVIYMRMLKGKEALLEQPISKKKKKAKDEVKHDVHHTINRGQMIRFAVIFFVLGSVVSGLTSFAVFKALNSQQTQKTVAAEGNQPRRLAEVNIVSPIPEEKVLGAESATKTITIIDLDGDFLRVRESPEGKVIGKAFSGEEYTFIKEENDWTQIKLEDGSGWISSDFVSQEK